MATIAFIQWITPDVLDDPEILRSLQEHQMFRALSALARRNGGHVVGDWRTITNTIAPDEQHPPGLLAWRGETTMATVDWGHR